MKQQTKQLSNENTLSLTIVAFIKAFSEGQAYILFARAPFITRSACVANRVSLEETRLICYGEAVHFAHYGFNC